MKYSPHIHHRRSIRLKGYDYSQNGAYFVTICVQNRKCLFGKITNRNMVLNDAGKMAEKYWQKIPEHFPNIILDAFVIMPNHMHGILIIDNVGVPLVGTQNKHVRVPLVGTHQKGQPQGIAPTTNTSFATNNHWKESKITSSTIPKNGRMINFLCIKII